jgi:hypothetical protein
MAKTGADIIANCRLLLNVPSGETNAALDAKLYILLNSAFRDMKFALIRTRQGYFLTYEYKNVVAGEDKIDIPAGMLNFRALFYYDSGQLQWRFLHNSQEMGFQDRDLDYTSDDFREYTIEGDQIRLLAIPETSVTEGLVFLNTLALTTDLASGTAIPLPDDYCPCLEYRILELYAVTVKDWDSAKGFRDLFYEARNDVKKIAWRRNEQFTEMIASQPDLL